MRPDVRRWFLRRTLRASAAPPAGALASRKAGQTVSVVLPALDEAATVGPIVSAIQRSLVEGAGLVDELVVVDAGSSDATAQVAADAGATVVSLGDVLPSFGERPGKGEALWKSLYLTDGDLVVYLEADVSGFDVSWVCGLLWPLLAEPGVAFVKACYDRPLALPGGAVAPTGGGRVTELTARPLIDLLWPALSGFVQPLAGECAARRSLLERLPFEGGYAVELGLLVDALAAVGLDAMAQVDLGVRRHRNQPTDALGRMAAGILALALERRDVETLGATLTQFVRADPSEAFVPVEMAVGATARPPMLGVAEYVARRAAAS